MDISGNKMLHLKQDLAFLRQRLAECSEESAKQSIRREIMEKETYYNIPVSYTHLTLPTTE